MTSLHLVALDVAKSGEAVKSGPIGFLIILLLCIACYFLFKSMSKHLRKVREDFPTDEPPAESTTPPAQTDEATTDEPSSTPERNGGN